MILKLIWIHQDLSALIYRQSALLGEVHRFESTSPEKDVKRNRTAGLRDDRVGCHFCHRRVRANQHAHALQSLDDVVAWLAGKQRQNLGACGQRHLQLRE